MKMQLNELLKQVTPGTFVAENDRIMTSDRMEIADCKGYSIRATDPVHKAKGGREANAAYLAHAANVLPGLAQAIQDAIDATQKLAVAVLVPEEIPIRFERINRELRAALAKVQTVEVGE